MYALLLDRKGKGQEPFQHLLFLSSLQLRIVNMPKQCIWGDIFWSLSLAAIFCSVIHSLSFKSIFQRMMLGSSVPKLLWMRHKFRILSLPPNQMKWSIWGGPRVHRFHKFPSSFQIFGFLVHRAPFMHSEKWLQLCGCFLSMGCECQSSRQSSLTPFTHACLPEWSM